MKHFIKGLFIGLLALTGLYTILVFYGPWLGFDKYPFLIPFTIAHIFLLLPLLAFFKHKKEKETVQGILFLTGIVYLLFASCYTLLFPLSFH